MNSALGEANLAGVTKIEQPFVDSEQETGFIAYIFGSLFEQRTQVLIGLVLLILIYINICLTSLAWRRYSKTIVLFFEEERKEKLRKEKEASEGKED